MALIVLGILLLAVYVWLSELARMGSTAARVAAAAVAIGLGAAATLGLMLAMWVDSLGSAGAVVVLTATLGWVCVSAALGSTLFKRDRDAIAWMVTAAVCFAVWTAYMAPLGDRFGI
jgi:hypothetical protein